MMNDLFSLKGRIALVTGGTRGIGRMIAQGFLQQGAKVYISGRNPEKAEAAARELDAKQFDAPAQRCSANLSRTQNPTLCGLPE